MPRKCRLDTRKRKKNSVAPDTAPTHVEDIGPAPGDGMELDTGAKGAEHVIGHVQKRAKRSKPQRNVAAAPKQTMARPGIWGAPLRGKHLCRHPLCGRETEGMLRVPKDQAALILKKCFDGLGGSRSYSKQVAKDVSAEIHLCPHHLSPEVTEGAVVSMKHVLHHKDDPIISGAVPGRNSQGTKRWDKIQETTSVPKRKLPIRPQSELTGHELRVSELLAVVEEQKKTIADLRKRNAVATKKAEDAAAAAAAAAPLDGGQSFLFSYEWMTETVEDDCTRCEEYTSLPLEGYKYWVQLAELSGAGQVYESLSGNQSSKRTLDYRDAITIAVSRLFRGPRCWRHYARMVGLRRRKVHASNLSGLCESAVVATTAVFRQTLLRHPDREVVEAERPPCLKGEFDETYKVMVVIDGFAFPVEYVSPPELHRLVHSVYKGTAVGQATILIDARLQIMAITPIYSGAAGEGPYVEDCKIFEKPEDTGCWLFQAGDWVMSDKGYRLTEYLRGLGLNLLKPTEMARGHMTEAQASHSRRVSQARAHSERVVFRVRRFDIFYGRKVQQSEWPMLDEYADLVCSLVMCLGPLSTQGRIAWSTSPSVVCHVGDNISFTLSLHVLLQRIRFVPSTDQATLCGSSLLHLCLRFGVPERTDPCV